MSTLLYFILLVISIIVLIRDLKRNNYLLGTVFFAVFVMYYVLTPVILGIYDNATLLDAENAPHLWVYANASEMDKLRAFFIILFSFIIIIALRRVKIVLRKGSKDNRQGVDLKNFNADFKPLNHTVFNMGVFFFILGGSALVELMLELGGIERMLSLGSMIRGYSTNNADYLSPIGAVCKTLSVFVTGSFFCFYSSSLKHKKHILLMILSLILSIIYLIFNAGRGPLVLFFACIMFAIIKEKGKKIIGLVVIGIIFIFFLSSSLEVVMNNLSLGLPAFYNMEYNMSDNLFASITNLAYPYANVLELPQMIRESGYNFCIDYILWFSEIIPERLLGFLVDFFPARTLVTTKVSQYYIQAGLSNGGTPADFITYGWFQGSLIGLLINCIVYDIILKYFDNSLRLLPKQYSIIKYRMCFFAYSLVTSNDLPLMLNSNLFLIVIMIVIGKSIRRMETKDEK